VNVIKLVLFIDAFKAFVGAGETVLGAQVLLPKRGSTSSGFLPVFLTMPSRCGHRRWCRDRSKRDLAVNTRHVVVHKKTPKQIVPNLAILAVPLNEQNTGRANALPGVKLQVDALLARMQVKPRAGSRLIWISHWPTIPPRRSRRHPSIEDRSTAGCPLTCLPSFMS